MKKRYIFIIIGILAVSFLSYCFFPVVFFQNKDLPWNVVLYDRNGILIADKATEFGYKKIIDLDLQSDFVKSLILIEDKNYFSHFWVDIISKLWAINSNITSKKIVSWWSTITEQYIKNRFFIKHKRTYLQKASSPLFTSPSAHKALFIFFSTSSLLSNMSILLPGMLELIFCPSKPGSI